MCTGSLKSVVRKITQYLPEHTFVFFTRAVYRSWNESSALEVGSPRYKYVALGGILGLERPLVIRTSLGVDQVRDRSGGNLPQNNLAVAPNSLTQLIRSASSGHSILAYR